METRIPALKPVRPERRRGGKLAAVLAVLFFIVMIVLFLQSSLSKVTEIQIRGTRHADPEAVRAAAGVQEGDWFLYPWASELERRVRTVPAVEDAVAVWRFPGLLIIWVREYPEVALEISPAGKLGIVLANGLAVPPAGTLVPDKPVLTGWNPDDPNRLALARELGRIPPELLNDVSEIVPDPSNAYPDRIRIYTRSRFEVVTTVSKLGEKLPYLDSIVENREPGLLTLLDADTYTPFSALQSPTEDLEGSPPEAEKTE